MSVQQRLSPVEQLLREARIALRKQRLGGAVGSPSFVHAIAAGSPAQPNVLEDGQAPPRVSLEEGGERKQRERHLRLVRQNLRGRQADGFLQRRFRPGPVGPAKGDQPARCVDAVAVPLAADLGFGQHPLRQAAGAQHSQKIGPEGGPSAGVACGGGGRAAALPSERPQRGARARGEGGDLRLYHGGKPNGSAGARRAPPSSHPHRPVGLPACIIEFAEGEERRGGLSAPTRPRYGYRGAFRDCRERFAVQLHGAPMRRARIGAPRRPGEPQSSAAG